jgi:predicted Zn-dependent peptidase
MIGGGWRTSSAFIDRVRAVTPADVRRVAGAYLKNIQFVVLGNPASIDKKIFLQPPGS